MVSTLDLKIWRLWSLAGFVSCIVSGALVYSQLVCLLPVGILNLLKFTSVVCFVGPEKLQCGDVNEVFIHTYCTISIQFFGT